jgi:phosphatidate phosphatase APP1
MSPNKKTRKQLLVCVLAFSAALAHADTHQVVIYDGFGSGERFTVEGRVIEEKTRSQAKPDDSWLSNLWRNFNFMRNSEKENVALTISIADNQMTATSNEEGYIRVDAKPAKPLPPGWHTVKATAKRAQGEGRVLIVPQVNTHGVISDIDDTVIVSEVNDKKKLLGNTFLQNATQRKTFPGTAAFYKRLLSKNAEPSAAPMFYLSASPRQLTNNITSFLTQNDFPPGPLVTKLINGDEKDPLLDQQKYKLAKIEIILAALPWVNFTLVGDDGEFDPEIYRAIQEKFPQRVSAIYIRKVKPDPHRVSYPGQLDLVTAIDGK